MAVLAIIRQGGPVFREILTSELREGEESSKKRSISAVGQVWGAE